MAEYELNFALPSEVTDLAHKVKTFVVEKVIPYEKDPRWTSHGPTDDLRRELNELARQAGVLAPHAPEEFGGQELSISAARWYSRPRAIRCWARSRCTAPRRTKATSICSTWSPGPTSASAGCSRWRRRRALLLLHDRARAGRRLRSRRCCRPPRGATATTG